MTSSLREPRSVTTGTSVADWLDAATTLSDAIVAGEVAEPEIRIVETVRTLAAADLTTIVEPTPDGRHLTVVAAVGDDSPTWQNMTVPADGTLTASVLHAGRARLLRDARDELGGTRYPTGAIESLLLVPLRAAGRVAAVLTVGRAPHRAPYLDADLAVVALFAGQVALALHHRAEQARLERASVTSERDRIARSMQANVIGRLFALGMTMQSAACADAGVAAGRLETASDEIDETIKAIRTTIYRLAD